MMPALAWRLRLLQPAGLRKANNFSSRDQSLLCRNYKSFSVCLATEHLSSAQGQQTQHITSTANSYVKHCAKLRTDGAYRQQQGHVVVSGLTPLFELAQEVPSLGIQVLIWADQDSTPPASLRPERMVTVSESVLKKISGLNSVEGLVAAAEVALPEAASFEDWPRGTLKQLLVLDGVQDPGNLGTLLRTALALGWQGAYILPGCCDPFNEKALRASRGAAFKLPLEFGSWGRLEQISEQHSLARLAAEPSDASTEGKSIQNTAMREPSKCQEWPEALGGLRVALVLGSEGQGLSPLARQSCTSVAIPMANMESLNVSQAGTILMFMLSKGMPHLLGRLLTL